MPNQKGRIAAIVLAFAALGALPAAAPNPAGAAEPQTLLYPGAEVLQSGMKGPGEETVFVSPASADQIVAYYAGLARQAGLSTVSDQMSGAGFRTVLFGRKGGGRTLYVIVAENQKGRRVTVYHSGM